MEVSRQQLLVLLNALYDLNERTISVRHPAEAIGELIRIDLGEPEASTVHITTGAMTYESLLDDIRRDHGKAISDELPNEVAYVKAMVASGLVDVRNREEIDTFLRRYGYQDLHEGHPPRYAGIDTNLLPWRMHDVLGIDPMLHGQDSEPAPINGYTLAEGVDAELRHGHRYGQTAVDATELAAALGSEFTRLAGQPNEDSREMRLGLKEYRRLRESRPHDIVESGEGDADIIRGCKAYYEDESTGVILFSNDHGFVERAREQKVPAIHVDFELDVPETITATWDEIALLLYEFAVLFGVIVLPKATLYGAWDDKDERNWRAEEIDVKCRSDSFGEILGREQAIVQSYENS
ncbi:hypothetical protein [Halapricum desulfuricans]|uniref:PIN domain n=1 Tax=Halapricum desulfuricans TaxID=2841257 RepID=A0A897NU89_9EURY|nr:hypothetical protein [Halapricum desulfuricans]QSG16327.1 PIN domain [Halapricum desulfuricans]